MGEGNPLQTAEADPTTAQRMSGWHDTQRLRQYLLVTDQNGNAIELRADRYEFWIYRQIRKRLNSGEVHLEDSLAHRCFNDELVSLDQKADVLRQLDIPWLHHPIDGALDSLFAELRQLWRGFDRDLRQGKLKHLEYNSANRTLSWHKPKTNDEEALQTATALTRIDPYS